MFYLIELRIINTDLSVVSTSHYQIAFKDESEITTYNLSIHHDMLCDVVIKNPFQENTYLAIGVDDHKYSEKLYQLEQEFAVKAVDSQYTSYTQAPSIQNDFFYQQLLKTFQSCELLFESLTVNPNCPYHFMLRLYEDRFHRAKATMYLVHYLTKYVSYHLGHSLVEGGVDEFQNKLESNMISS